MVWTKKTKTSTTFTTERDVAYLLCEDDTFLLQEDDFKIALEWYWTHQPDNPVSWTKVPD